MKAHNAWFKIDGIPGIYVGYTFNHRWNGWGCPCFTKPIAMKIMHAINQLKDETLRLEYDPTDDTFMEISTDGSGTYTDIYATSQIETESGYADVYHIGAFGWCWQKHEL